MTASVASDESGIDASTLSVFVDQLSESVNNATDEVAKKMIQTAVDHVNSAVAEAKFASFWAGKRSDAESALNAAKAEFEAVELEAVRHELAQASDEAIDATRTAERLAQLAIRDPSFYEASVQANRSMVEKQAEARDARIEFARLQWTLAEAEQQLEKAKKADEEARSRAGLALIQAGARALAAEQLLRTGWRPAWRGEVYSEGGGSGRLSPRGTR